MNRGQIIKMILMGIVGVLVGFIISKLIPYFPSLDPLMNMIKENLIYAMLIPAFVGLCGIIKFISIRNTIKDEDYSDEEDSTYENKGHILQATMSLGTLTHILNFMFTGINGCYLFIEGEIDKNKILIFPVLILINVSIATYLEVANINLVKKMEPNKNADPISFKYNQDAIDKLDERELIIAGKASLKADALMPFVYALLFLIGIIALPSPLYFIGVLAPWGINVIVKTIYTIKEMRGK